jgi:hypothetical protein
MTQLDIVLTELAGRIRQLSQRAQAALFWACSDALTPEFLAWANHTGAGTEGLLRAGQAAAYNYAAWGAKPAEPAQLLAALEAGTPFGESPDDFPSTRAQDCWICADIAVRVWAVGEYDAAPAIEYALEPMLGAVTEELFGVTQVGSGPDEERQVAVVLQDARIVRAITFVRWATDFLSVEPSEEALSALRARSEALLPPF